MQYRQSDAPRISVIIPAYNQAHFLARALDSLFAQQEARWEAILIDDGSTDSTPAIARRYLDDQRLSYRRLSQNRGLGAALNRGLSLARAPFIAYLPSDDVYYPEHLAQLLACIEASDEAVLAYSGLRHDYGAYASGQIAGEALQLVQVLHHTTGDRWVERDELVTDDLERMYWSQLRKRGACIATGAVSCEWVFHPDQMHRLIRLGGLNAYRVRYNVREPMRFHSTETDLTDEVEHYRRFRERPDTPPAADGLKILLVGELAHNPERILALEERGHRLYGLWTPEPWWFNTVGPLPFGHVQDLPREDWREAVRRLQPDLIYALLNWQAVPFAHEVLRANPGVPFVWHFKEGPFACLDHGLWRELVELLTGSDGQIYSSPEVRDWFETALPAPIELERTLVLDGDLPKREWFTDEQMPLLSEMDGQIHTVVSGRPRGIDPVAMRGLADAGIHVHVYGTFHEGDRRAWIAETLAAAPEHLHLHPTVHQEHWVREFSRYDAGWLHRFRSHNGGDLRKANWDDLNYPARMSTMAVAGLPMLQLDNSDAIVATEALTRRLGVGLFFTRVDQLREQLVDRRSMARLRANVWAQREQFCFDEHADRLIAFFRQIIARSRPVAPE
jgi:glycosyltransferase involved in cell wall biosynthesis